MTDTALNMGESDAAHVTVAGLLPIYAMTNALQILAAAAGDAQGKNGVRLRWANAGTTARTPGWLEAQTPPSHKHAALSS